MRHGVSVVHARRVDPNLHFFRNLPMGVALWRLHDPRSVRSLRFLGVNPAGERELRAPVGFAVGKLIADCFPKLLETHVPESCRRVALSGKPDTIGEVTYHDTHIPEGIFRMDCFPLPHRCAGLVVENITERKRTIKSQNDALQLLHRVTLFLNGASTVTDAAQFCVDEICKQIGWPVGRFFLSDEASPSRFLPNPVWHVSDVHRFAAFRRATELYERDLTNRLALEHRMTQGRKAGLAKSVGFSVVENDSLRGVLEFSSENPAPLDEHAFRAISNIGFQLGQVFARERFDHDRRLLHGSTLTDDLSDLAIWQVLERSQSIICTSKAAREVQEYLSQIGAVTSHDVLAAMRRAKQSIEEARRLIAESKRLSGEPPFCKPEGGRSLATRSRRVVRYRPADRPQHARRDHTARP